MADGPIITSVSAKLHRAEKIENELKKHPAAADNAEDPPTPEESNGRALSAVTLRQQEQKLKQRKQDMRMRARLAKWAILFVAVQLGLANIFFFIYLMANLQTIEASVMIAWLSSCVIEVVGILWVIARSLFPYRDKSVPNGKKDLSTSASKNQPEQ